MNEQRQHGDGSGGDRTAAENPGPPVAIGTQVDLDLLADYLGGALDGTAQGRTVARLVATDPRWSRSCTQLSAALDAVGRDLAELGARCEPIPQDVLARLDAAIAGAGPAPTAPTAPTAPAVDAAPAPAGDGARVIRLPARSGWRRWVAPIGVAAALLVGAGLGLGVLLRDGSDPAGREANTVAGGALPGTDAGTGPAITTSGADYHADTVARAAGMVLTAVPGLRPEGTEDRDATATLTIPTGLAAFADPTRLDDCLHSIQAAHDRPAATVELVDLARYDGAPAIVVVLREGASDGWVWVSGAGCGADDPDTLFTTRIG